MNGAHDLGGMHGFGRIEPEPEEKEPVFHAAWEKRVFGLVLALGAVGKWSIDQSRYARERQRPLEYLRHTYYETWLEGLNRLLVESGLVSVEELATGRATSSAEEEIRARVIRASQVDEVLAKGSPVQRVIAASPRFRPGDRVRAVNRHPAGHTREPRYVRGHVGVIHAHHGAHVFADLSAEGVSEGRHLYSVRFELSELWGREVSGRGAVNVDLWEDYLEQA